MMSDTLAALSDHFGIGTTFWDWKGHLTQVDPATVVSILAALDVDASTEESAKAALAGLKDERWRRTVEPCVVIQENRGGHVTIHLPAGTELHVWIRLEDGSTRPAWPSENLTPDRWVDGSLRGEATYWLGSDLPLGYHRIVVTTVEHTVESALIVTPAKIDKPPAMANRRVWGYATQLYSVRSKRSWGIGDLMDLSDMCIWSATQQFADYVLINPLHASQPAPPLEPSPYLPSTRRYINPISLRPEAIEEYARLKKRDRVTIEQLRESVAKPEAQSIDRNAVWDAKIEALRIIFKVSMTPARQMAFNDFIKREGRSLRDFAAWCALTVVHGRRWREWPLNLQRPSSPEVAAFSGEHAGEIRFFMWMQWVAELQVSNAQARARGVGMSLGIIQDLAVGVDADGVDTWMLHDVFARGCNVGAPPDPFNQTGQDWGQPPWRPDRLAELAYAPFRAVVAASLRNAGGIRVDHIIGLFRLWWVPAGGSPKDGAYVRYDHEAMVGILALEAHRAQALVIGEDLGTVEPWVRDYLTERGLFGTSVLWFENDWMGTPLDASAWREYCMASVTTHDLPPTAGYLAGDHVVLRDKLGLLTQSLDLEMTNSAREQSALIQKLRDCGHLGVDEDDPYEIMLAMHRFLASTPAKVLNVTLTDAVGDRRTQNQPGTIDEYPNWRVPLAGQDGKPLLLDDVFRAELPRRVAAIVNGLDQLPPSRWDV